MIEALAVVAILGAAYALRKWSTARRAASLVLAIIGKFAHRFDKTAVALRVEADINDARARLLADGPAVLASPVKIEFAKAAEAAAVVRGGATVVVMRPSSRHEENVTHALMAYLPRAVLPIARPYLASETVRAVDFTVAKAFLSSETLTRARDYFNERLLEPARQGNRRLADLLSEMDTLDMHGWLTRVLMVEYKRLGDVMYPGPQDERFTLEADSVAGWLYKVAQPDQSGSLQYRGQFFRVAIVFVAAREKLLREGLGPYRNRVINLLYNQDFHAVHLMGRDQNIEAVRELVAMLVEQDLVTLPDLYEYNLRSDFTARRFARKRAICVALRRNPARSASEPTGDLPSSTFDGPETPPSPTPATFPFHVEQGTICEIEKTRGFGFITTPSGSRLFFHSSQLTDCALHQLRVGQQVLYRKIFDPKRNKHHAETVKVLPATSRADQTTRSK